LSPLDYSRQDEAHLPQREQEPTEELDGKTYSPLWVIGTSFTVLSLIGTALSLLFTSRLLTITSFIVTIIGIVGTALSFVRWKSLTSWNPLAVAPSRRVRSTEEPPPLRRRRSYEQDDYRDRPSRRRARDFEDDDDRRRRRGFRCPYCRSTEPPLIYSRISAAGWVVFVVMLLFCLPLFFIGLLMQEEYRVCRVCRARLARAGASGASQAVLWITLILCVAVVLMCLFSGMVAILTPSGRY
jgi:lipopolysaccharide-induced tumor necrosis factor-alpha factor